MDLAEGEALLGWVNLTAELAPGIHFFSWARNMTVDAFFTIRASR